MADDAGLSVKVSVNTTGPDKAKVVKELITSYEDYSSITKDNTKGLQFVCPLHLLGPPTIKTCREFYGFGILKHCGSKSHPVVPRAWRLQYSVGERE